MRVTQDSPRPCLGNTAGAEITAEPLPTATLCQFSFPKSVFWSETETGVRLHSKETAIRFFSPHFHSWRRIARLLPQSRAQPILERVETSWETLTYSSESKRSGDGLYGLLGISRLL